MQVMLPLSEEHTFLDELVDCYGTDLSLMVSVEFWDMLF